MMASASASATTYYIDFSSGKDSNSGTSKAAPWQHHPYMAGWAGSYAHQAGDRFIFKGGVTWNATCWPMNISASGSSGSNDYYGVDQSWFAGGSFTKPIFDGQHTTQQIIQTTSVKYITFDHLELKGQHAPDNGCCYFNIYLYDSYNILMEYLYIHDWDFTGAVTNVDQDWGSVYANTFGARPVGIVFDHSEMGNPENGALGGCLRMVEQVSFSNIHDCSQGLLHGGALVYNNQFKNVGNVIGGTHNNVMYLDNWGGPSNFEYVYNNLLINNSAATQIYVNSCQYQNGGTSFIYNNVIEVNNSQPGIILNPESGSGPCGNAFIYNNTLQNSSGGTAVIRAIQNASGTNSFGTVTVRNNHLITDNLTPIDNSGVVLYTESNEVLQTNAVANQQGYTASNNYAPIASSTATVGVGMNLTSLAIPTLNLDINNTPRPSTGAWNAGGYSASSTAQRPNPPLALSAAVQ
jgi:hypothetical protein